MMADRVTVPTRLFYTIRSAVYRSYWRLTAINYHYGLLATPKRIRNRWFRSYELINIHGRDWLLSQLLDRCRPGDTVIDVGANVGTYALAVATTCSDCSVFAIEPNPETYRKLQANIAANGFDERIVPLELGLSDRSGSAPFYRSTYHELSSFSRFNASRWEAAVAEECSVPIEPLDRLIDTGEIDPPDHLKIDVEGTGHTVLLGATTVLTESRPIIYLEPHATDSTETDTGGIASRAIYTLLDEFDYAVTTRGDAWIATPTTERGPHVP